MIIVMKAHGLPKEDPLFPYSLPVDYSFLVDSDSQRIIEPALLWLTYRFPPFPRRWKSTTVDNAAYNLCMWWRFLDGNQLQWDEIGRPDLNDYCNLLLSSTSPRTGTHYELGSIRRYLGSVIGLYDWARTHGLYAGPTLVERKPRKVLRRADTDLLAGLGRSHSNAYSTRILPRAASQRTTIVHPFSPREWKLVSQELGSLPSELRGNSIPVRDRLAAELSIFTGARITEIAKLTITQVLRLNADDCDDDYPLIIELRESKGDVPRNLLVPAHLVRELQWYIDNERKECVEAARRYGLTRDPKILFVNSTASDRNVGRPVSRQTLFNPLHRAVISAGLTYEETKTIFETGERFVVQCAKHSFHDLRHTFACWYYEALREKGEAEPWKALQARLGHKHLSTTVDTYLKVVDTFRIEINTAYYHFLRRTIAK